MKKFIFSLIVLVGASSAYADANLAMEDNLYKKYADESKSHYQVLGHLFKNSSAPDIKKLVGVAWAGRCFNWRNPNAASNSAFFLRVARKADAGPIGKDKEKTYEAASYPNESDEPNYYDTMTFEEMTNGINHLLRKVKSYEDSIVPDYSHSNASYSELKISGKYLIKEISYRGNLQSTSPYTIEKNTYVTHTRCYYFIPKYRKK